MGKKKKDELPKLPYGMGAYSWHDASHTLINYKKNIGEGKNRKRHSVYAKTVAECNRLMAEAERKYTEECREKAIIGPRDAGVPLTDSVKAWLVQYKYPTVRGRTYDTLEGTFERYLCTAPFARDPVASVTDLDIQEWLNGIAMKYSQSTVKKCHSLIKMYCDFYFVRDMARNPMLTVNIPKSKVPPKTPDGGHGGSKAVLDDEEIARFETEAMRKPSPGRPGTKHGDFLLFTMWMFMRYSEVIALRWEDIDFDRGTVLVHSSEKRVRSRDGDGNRKTEYGSRYEWETDETKTESGTRVVTMPDQAVEAITRHRDSLRKPPKGSDPVFTTSNGTPVSDDYANRILRAVLSRAGIKKHVTIHGLRHTGISYFIRNGMDKEIVSRMAGHSSVQVTERIYYSLTDEQIGQEVKKAGRKNRKISGNT